LRQSHKFKSLRGDALTLSGVTEDY
jgi:hypothetical protein